MLLVGLATLLGWSFLPASPPGPPREIVLARDDLSQSVAALEQAGLMDAPGLMKLYVTLLSPGVGFKPRTHLLRGGLTPRELVRSLSEVGPRATVHVTFPEGQHRFSMAQKLEQNGVCAASAFLAASTDRTLLARLEIPAPSAEGYLFPSTYEFHEDADPERIVERLVRESRRRLGRLVAEMGGLSPELVGLGLGHHEVVVLASIIEKETGHGSERARVARVFLNRLAAPEGETGGRLQSDPTAAYGCLALGSEAPASCEGAGRVTPRMLRDAGNPYNTYRHAGLPPGPIGNPGLLALRAVLQPAPGKYLYFVADGAGRHSFSENYADHKEAVRRLQQVRKAVP